MKCGEARRHNSWARARDEFSPETVDGATVAAPCLLSSSEIDRLRWACARSLAATSELARAKVKLEGIRGSGTMCVYLLAHVCVCMRARVCVYLPICLTFSL